MPTGHSNLPDLTDIPPPPTPTEENTVPVVICMACLRNRHHNSILALPLDWAVTLSDDAQCDFAGRLPNLACASVGIEVWQVTEKQ